MVTNDYHKRLTEKAIKQITIYVLNFLSFVFHWFKGIFHTPSLKSKNITFNNEWAVSREIRLYDPLKMRKNMFISKKTEASHLKIKYESLAKNVSKQINGLQIKPIICAWHAWIHVINYHFDFSFKILCNQLLNDYIHFCPVFDWN